MLAYYKSIFSLLISFAAPESDPSDITPSRTSMISVPSSQSMKHSLSTISPVTTTMPDKPVTDHEQEVSDDGDISTQPPISIGGSPPMGITIAAVLGVLVIVGILLGIAILLAVLYRRVKRRPRVSTKSALNLQNATLIGKFIV
jgi:beta-lactamase regulating signal transducer with metallopeptidase domain